MDSYKKIEAKFVDDFYNYVKTNGEHKTAYDIITKDFIKNTDDNYPTDIFQTVKGHSKHVALLQVKLIGGRKARNGTLFLLTESLGLTCYDLVKDIQEPYDQHSIIGVAYTEMGVEIQRFSAGLVGYSESFNCAFLRVTKNPIPDCPGGLLQHLALPPQDGTVAIADYPKGQRKHIDVSSVINFNNGENGIHPSIVHVLTQHHFMKLSSPSKVNKKTPGAPMFNNCGELVAMHTGGYTIKISTKKETVIEYGRSIVEIIIMGAVEIEDLCREFLKLVERNEALQSYMSSDSHSEDMKKFVETLNQLWKEKNPAKLQQTDFKMVVDSAITERMIALGSSQLKSRDELENKECEHLPLKLFLESTISDEDDLRNMLHANYISSKVFILRRLLFPSPDDEKTQKSPPLEKIGCYKCKSKRCKVCRHMKESTAFTSSQTGETYNIRQHIDCNSTYVIYLITCTECSLQYVGYAKNGMKERLSNHKSKANLKKKNPSSVFTHFQTCHEGDFKCLQLQGIQRLENSEECENRDKLLKNMEAVWIWRLKTVRPHGVNIKKETLSLPVQRQQTIVGKSDS